MNHILIMHIQIAAIYLIILPDEDLRLALKTLAG
jgi:hypothetical protein